MSDDEATRIFNERRIQNNQVAVENRALLLRQIGELQASAPARLKAAGYPENGTSASVISNGRHQAAWVVQLSETHNHWVGVFPDGSLVALQGTVWDKSPGKLRVTGAYNLDEAPAPVLGAIKALLEMCTQTKRWAWEPD